MGRDQQPTNLEFDKIVSNYHGVLYKFALSLMRTEGEACDLVQQTFLFWLRKGDHLRDETKIKSWLFTTLYREFLRNKKRGQRIVYTDTLEELVQEFPNVESDIINRLDGAQVLDLLTQLEEMFRVPLTLFYLEDCSYREIAEILGVPLGTVQSRIARGKALLYGMLVDQPQGREITSSKVKHL